jgi:hypothetical protein
MKDIAYDYMLTTIDNPFNPFDEFDRWREFDEYKGYYTCEYLARIAITTDEMSEEEEDYEILRAMDEIIDVNSFGLHAKKARAR